MAVPLRPDAVKILVVDDQPAKLLTYDAILTELGEELIRANSASEALEALLKHEIAVVLADVCMPDLDGYELAAMIRQHPRCQKTSIIFVSAVMMAEPDRLRGYQSGAVDYVPVPVVPEILRAKVGIFAELYRKTRALEELNAELERRVAARTAELEATTAALREADRRKDEFLAMLAHELRNPLAPIRTAVQLLRLKELPEAHSARARDTIDRQVEHLVILIDDLLDVSRITRGMITLQREPVPASAIVARAIEITRPAIDARRHELVLELADEPLTIEGDRTRLVQIVGNILHNATKFMEPGGRIVLRVAREGGSAVFTVKDDGIGIPADRIDRVFDLFTQVHGTGDGAQGGLGIGLALVRRLVEMHGGSVAARSEGTGRGTEIRVCLPLTTATLPAAEAERGTPQVDAAPLPPQARRRILDRRRQRRRRRIAGAAARAGRARGPHRPGRPRGARRRPHVPAGGRPPRSRDAGDGRLRDGAAPAPAGLGQADAPDRAHRLGAAAGSPAHGRSRLRRPPGEAGVRAGSVPGHRRVGGGAGHPDDRELARVRSGRVQRWLNHAQVWHEAGQEAPSVRRQASCSAGRDGSSGSGHARRQASGREVVDARNHRAPRSC